MRLLFILALVTKFCFAIEYYAKVEPLNSYTIKASVSGKVIFTNDKIEGNEAKNSTIIEIDSYVDRVELEQTRKKLKHLKDMITLENENYIRLSKVSSKSGFEKDTQKIKVYNLEYQKSELVTKIAELEDTIKNKKLVEKDGYIYNIDIKKGDYVTAGTTLYEKDDLSKGKVEIFIPLKDVNDIRKKQIYLDGKKSDLKIDKLYKVADKEQISSYKCEIIIPEVDMFSKLIKVEFK